MHFPISTGVCNPCKQLISASSHFHSKTKWLYSPMSISYALSSLCVFCPWLKSVICTPWRLVLRAKQAQPIFCPSLAHCTRLGVDPINDRVVTEIIYNRNTYQVMLIKSVGLNENMFCSPEELSFRHESLRGLPLPCGGEDCVSAVSESQIHAEGGLHGSVARAHGPGHQHRWELVGFVVHQMFN